MGVKVSTGTQQITSSGLMDQRLILKQWTSVFYERVSIYSLTQKSLLNLIAIFSSSCPKSTRKRFKNEEHLSSSVKRQKVAFSFYRTYKKRKEEKTQRSKINLNNAEKRVPKRSWHRGSPEEVTSSWSHTFFVRKRDPFSNCQGSRSLDSRPSTIDKAHETRIED